MKWREADHESFVGDCMVPAGVRPGFFRRVCLLVLVLVLPSIPSLATCHEAHSQAATSHSAEHSLLPPSMAQLQRDPVAHLHQQVVSGAKRGDLLIYNRVPKAGSTSMQLLVRRLAKRLGYSSKHFSSPPHMQCPIECIHDAGNRPSDSDLREFADIMLGQCPGAAREPSSSNSSATQPNVRCFLDYHFKFINYSQARPDLAQPMYMNSVREPISRIISKYNYARYGRRPGYLKQRFLRQFGNLTMDQCMELYKECKCQGSCDTEAERACTKSICRDLFLSFNSQMMAFCPWGHPACGKGDEASLRQALRTLEVDYEAVTVLEDPERSFRLLEAVFPTFFAGLTKMKPVKAKTGRGRGISGWRGGGAGAAGASGASGVQKRKQPRLSEAVQSSFNGTFTAEQLQRIQDQQERRRKRMDRKRPSSQQTHPSGRHVTPGRRLRAESGSAGQGLLLETTRQELLRLNSLDVAFYERAVELLEARAEAAWTSPARRDLELALGA